MSRRQLGDVLALMVIFAICVSVYAMIARDWDDIADSPAHSYSGAAIADDPTCPLHRGAGFQPAAVPPSPSGRGAGGEDQ